MRVLQQVELLEDHADVLARVAQLAARERGEVAPADEDLARIGPLQQVDEAQQRRFAGAALADQAEHVALLDVERQRLHGVEHLAVGQGKGLLHRLKTDDWRRVIAAARVRRRVGHGKEAQPAQRQVAEVRKKVPSMKRNAAKGNEQKGCCLYAYTHKEIL